MSPIAALAKLMVLFAGILFLIMPEMSRPGILFGVSVSPDFRSTVEGRTLIVSYRRAIAFLTLGLIALFSLVSTKELWIPLRISLEGLGGIGCWIWSSRKTIPFAERASSIRVASLTPQRQLVPGGWLFVLGPYLILGLAALFLYLNWNSIPESFPMHWGRNGLPDKWSNRTVMGVFGLLLVALAANTMMILIAVGFYFGARWSRSAAGVAAGDMAFKRATFFVVLFVGYFISTLFAVLSTRPAWSANPVRSPSQMVPVILMSVLALVIGSIVYLSRVAQSRMGSGDGTPDECWKWGLFYYNPNDAALFVEKRMGIGWTLNFAHKKAWAFMALMLLPSILIIFGTVFAVRSAK